MLAAAAAVVTKTLPGGRGVLVAVAQGVEKQIPALELQELPTLAAVVAAEVKTSTKQVLMAALALSLFATQAVPLLRPQQQVPLRWLLAGAIVTTHGPALVQSRSNHGTVSITNERERPLDVEEGQAQPTGG